MSRADRPMRADGWPVTQAEYDALLRAVATLCDERAWQEIDAAIRSLIPPQEK